MAQAPQFKIKKELYTPLSILASGVLISATLFLTLSERNIESRKAAASGQSALTQDSPGANADAGSVAGAEESATATGVSVDNDPVLGNSNAPVTLIEFTDYQCPYCSRHFNSVYKQLKSEYIDSGKVKLVVRDLPLSLHPNANKAAQASECAKDQNKFWEMHDKLFETQSSWAELSDADAQAYFKTLAKNVGANEGQFGSCLDTNAKVAEIESDSQDAAKNGVQGTPAFFVAKSGNDQWTKVFGAQTFEVFKAAIDAELAK